jgi:hypothetical protein
MILLDGESTGANSVSSAMSRRPVARRGAPHTFANGTDEDVPVLMFVTPAGFERYFADGAARAPCSSLRPGRSDRPGRPHE